MTDKEILAEVYRMLCQHKEHSIRTFIEGEWQKADEQELVDQYNRNRKAEDHIIDVTEIERHRGLIIGEDGTVKSLE
jgi:hypothetical protein